MNTAASCRVLHLKQEANTSNLLGHKQNLAIYKANSAHVVGEGNKLVLKSMSRQNKQQICLFKTCFVHDTQ